MVSKQDKGLRIVLLGKTGAGKSASGNTILGKKAFRVIGGFMSISDYSEKYLGTVGNTKVTIIDTPGLFDTRWTPPILKSKIERCVTLSVPGPHVFLLVIRLDVRFTEEEKNAVKWIQENFGKEAVQFTMVLFTHADMLNGDSVKDRIEQVREIRGIINMCGGGYHAFNNNRNDQNQVEELLGKIEAMVERNGGEYYTNELYQEAQKKIEEEEKRKKQEDKMRRNEIEKRIREDERNKIECRKFRFLVVGVGGAVGGLVGAKEGVVGIIGGGIVGAAVGFSAHKCYECYKSFFAL